MPRTITPRPLALALAPLLAPLLTTLLIICLALLPACAPTRGPRASLETAAPLASSTSQPLAAAALAGTWRGVYHAYPAIYELTATLEPAGNNRLEGELTFEPMDTGTRSSIGVNAAGTGRLSVSLDPIAATVRLTPSAPTDPLARQRARSTRLPPSMSGVYARALDAIGGHIDRPRSDSSPYFALGRGASGDQIVAAAKSVASQSRGASAARPLALLFRPSESKLIEWGKRFLVEYPGIDPYRTEFGALYTRARNLFADDHMTAHFGHTYDEMSRTDRAAVNMKFRGARGDLREFQGFASGFASSGTYSDADIMVSILGQRILRLWRASALASIDAMPPGEESFARIDTLVAAVKAHSRSLWPSEQTGFDAAADATRARIALPVAEARATALAASASGLGGARQILSFSADNADILRHVPAADRARLTALLEARLDPILNAAVEGRIKQLDALGSGIQALANGCRWHADLMRDFGPFAKRAPIARASAALKARRAADLAAAEPELLRRVAAAKSRDELERLARSHLAVPGDPNSPVGERIGRLFSQQLSAIDRLRAREVAVIRLLAAAGLHLVGDAALEGEDDLGNLIIAGLARYTRDQQIAYAMDEFLPDQPEAVRQNLASLVKRALDGDTSLQSMSQDAIERMIRSQLKTPAEHTVADATLLILDLRSRRSDLAERNKKK